MLPPMDRDPKGFYARLGVSPGAGEAAITAAFRREARRVHPDIPGTGDADAFLALKAAYDILGDPERRAEYDRSAAAVPGWRARAGSSPHGNSPARALDLSVLVWIAVLGVGAIAATAAFLNLTGSPPPPAQPAATPPPQSPLAEPLAAQPAGVPTHYIAAGFGPATVWRSTQGRLIPEGHLAPFTGVHAVGIVPEHGLIAIALTDGGVGFVDAARLVPGDAAEARRAYCTDRAGPPPERSELLTRRGPATQAQLTLHNRGEEPVVVKLRDLDGSATASVFIAPETTATVTGLPAGPWRADVALGELWSRVCGSFIVGMRAARLPGLILPGATLIVPPETEPAEIPGEAFSRD
jgi:hypothetical protein